MGVQDRDWWREHYREQRQREAQAGLHRFNVRGSSRPHAAPRSTRRNAAWVSVILSGLALAATSSPGQRLLADFLDLGRHPRSLAFASATPAPLREDGATYRVSKPNAGDPSFPDSGSVVYSRLVEEPTSRLHLITRVGDDCEYVARLYDATTEDLVATIYLRGGHQVSVRAPYGAYRLKIASGRRWLGEAALFGMEGRVEEAATPLLFYPTAEGGSFGQTVVLSGVVNGNLVMNPIASRRF